MRSEGASHRLSFFNSKPINRDARKLVEPLIRPERKRVKPNPKGPSQQRSNVLASKHH
nr:putative integron gene cassette protein [uncultured bacterium]